MKNEYSCKWIKWTVSLEWKNRLFEQKQGQNDMVNLNCKVTSTNSIARNVIVLSFAYLFRLSSLEKSVMSFSTSSENKLSCKLIYCYVFLSNMHNKNTCKNSIGWRSRLCYFCISHCPPSSSLQNCFIKRFYASMRRMQYEVLCIYIHKTHPQTHCYTANET